MFEDKVLIVKLPAVDGLAAGAVVIGEIASLAHKLRDDAMKAAAFEAEALLVCAQAAEILYKNMIKKKKIDITICQLIFWLFEREMIP